MKVTHVLTCALVASAVSASAASVEQILNFSVVGWYQGVTTNYGVMSHERTAVVRFNTQNIVHALAIDSNTPSFFNGQLYYKSVLDGTNATVVTNQVVIRNPGSTNELDVTSAFTFTSGQFVIEQLVNTQAQFTNTYVETGLRAVSFTSSNLSFTNVGFATGTLRRLHKVTSNIRGTNYTAYPELLTYSGGAGLFNLNTNQFFMTNFQFAATNTVTNGPAQINFSTLGPIITTAAPTNTSN